MNAGLIIVTYHPDNDKLRIKLSNLITVVSDIVVVNNGTENISKNNINVPVINLKKNMGIAYAQNIGANYLIEKGIKLIFFLDQDSNVSRDFFSKMLQLWVQISKIDATLGIISPTIYDVNINKQVPVLQFRPNLNKRYLGNNEILKNTMPISSGMLVSVNAFSAVKGMQNSMFIDWVDFEFDLRILHCGFSTYTVGNVILSHSIGNSKSRRLFNSKFYPSNPAIFREFYFFRNAVWLVKSYSNEFNGLLKFVSKSLIFRLFSTIYEHKTLARLKQIVSGFIVGIITSSKRT